MLTLPEPADATEPGETRTGKTPSEWDRALFDEQSLPDTDIHYRLSSILWGGRVDPMAFPINELGIDGYISALGASRVRGVELVRVRRHQQQMVRSLYPHAVQTDLRDGRALMIPARWAWPRLACCAWIVDRCARAQTGPAWVLYGWRPREWNTAVKGMPASDHLGANGVDILFSTAKRREHAVARVIAPLWRLGLFELSVGLGNRKVHVGLFSARGRRRWKYPSYPHDWPF